MDVSWYPPKYECKVPPIAQYKFPSQAPISSKVTPRVPPVNDDTFVPGEIIRIDFPTDGYLNPKNTVLDFDVTIVYGEILVGDKNSTVRFQNNIESIFQRVRLLYGATVIEDIPAYNRLVRLQTEWSTDYDNKVTSESLSKGIGGCVFGTCGSISSTNADFSTANRQASLPGLVNVRQAYIHGVSTSSNANSAATNSAPTGMGFGPVPAGTIPITVPIPALATNCDLITTTDPLRNYTIRFSGLGFFKQENLIPTKFMSSKLSIEIVLAQASDCIYAPNSSNTPSYFVSNVNLIPEILEFSSCYGYFILIRSNYFKRLKGAWDTN